MGRLIRYEDAGCVFARDFSQVSTDNLTGTVTYVNGPYGRAINFDTYSYKSYEPNGLENISNLTIAARIKVSSNAGTVMSCTSPISSSGLIRFGINPTGMIFFVLDDGVTPKAITNSGWADDEYHNIICTYDGSTMRLYVDGALEDSLGSVTSFDFSSVTSIRIGANATTGGYNYPDDIKEVIVDQRAWTLQEAINYHKNQVFDYDKNIVRNYQLDATDTIKDLSPFGSDDLSVTGTASIINTPVGKGMEFNGVDTVVGLGDSILPTDGGAYSVVAYVKANNKTDPLSGIVSQYKGGQTGRTIPIYQNVTTWRYFNEGSLNFTYGDIVNGKYEFISMSNDGSGNADLYFNGDYITTATGSNNTLDVETVIGGIATVTSLYTNFFNGTIAKVIIFNKRLSNIEHIDIMNRIKRGDL